MSRTKPGDGSGLRPVSGMQWTWRGQFVTEVDGHEYAVDTDFFDLAERMLLYRDGVQVARAASPATFVLAALPDAPEHAEDTRIEAAMSLYGMKRAHVVTGSGERQLAPAPGTAEAWRARFERDRPGLSRLLAVLSFTILALALVLELPQLLEWVTSSGWWQAVSDWTFTSPVTLSAPANTAMTTAGVAAGLERALRVRHQWWLDD